MRASGSGDLFLGLDLGTSSLKALALDASGSILAVDSAGYPMYQPVSGAAEQDPRVYFAAERTLLAWIRTGVALMAFGFAIARFGLFLRQMQAARTATTAHGIWGSPLTGVVLIALGILVNVSAEIKRLLYVGQDPPDLCHTLGALLLIQCV